MNETIRKRQLKDRENLLEQLRKTPIIQLACEKAGIGRATYYRWRKTNPKFARSSDDALQESVSLMNDLAESQLLSAIREKNMTAIIFWLKNRHRAYTNKLNIDAKVETKDSKLTVEQEDLIKKALSLSNLTNIERNEDEQVPANTTGN